MAEKNAYLFGFTETAPPDGLPAGPLGHPHGIALPAGGFAIVSSISESWNDHDLTDIAWVAPRAIHHDAVLVAVVGACVIPLRFGSLFSNRDALMRECETLGPELAGLFDETTGRAEYRVSARAPEPSPDAAVSGTEYLRRRKQASQQNDAAQHDVTVIATSCTAACRNAPSRPGTSVVDVLASPHELDRLKATLVAADYDVSIDGPLPPYHFVELGRDGDAER